MPSKQVTWGALISYGAIGFNIISGLLYTPWMIHTIGDDQYALYALAISIINVFLLDFGIGAAVAKFLSSYYARGQYDEANDFMGLVYKTFIAISIVIALALIIFYFFIDYTYAKLTPSELSMFKILFVIVASYSVLSFPMVTFNGTLIANERFIELKSCNLGQKVLSVCLIIVLLLLDFGVYALVLVQAISNVIFFSLKFFIIRTKTRQRVNWQANDKKIIKSLFGFSIWVTVMGIAQRCIFNIMPTLIAATLNSKVVTLFSIAVILESYVYTFADAINGMFLPKVSRLLIQDDVKNKLTKLMTMVGRFHVYTLGVLYIGFICLGQEFVHLWMGDGYSAVYTCALLLILPCLVEVPQQVASTTLLAQDVIKEQAFIFIGMGVFNVLIALLLMPMFGVTGAAAAICIAYMFRTVALNYLYKKKLPVNLGAYFINTYGRWIPVATLSILAGFFLVPSISIAGWLGFILKGVLLATFYSLLLWFIGLNSNERRKISSLFKTMISK